MVVIDLRNVAAAAGALSYYGPQDHMLPEMIQNVQSTLGSPVSAQDTVQHV